MCLFTGHLHCGPGRAQAPSDKCRTQAGPCPNLGNLLDQLPLTAFKQSHRLDHPHWAHPHLLNLCSGLKSCFWPPMGPLEMPKFWHTSRKEATLYESLYSLKTDYKWHDLKKRKKKRKKTWFWITTFKARCVGHKFLTPLSLRDGIYSPSSWIWVVCDKSDHHSQKPNLVTWRAHVQKEMSSSPRCPCHSADLGVSHLGIPGLLAILLQQHEQLQTRLAEKKGSHCFMQQSLGMAFYRAKDNWNREVASLKNIFLPLHGHTTEIIKMNCST